MVASVPLVLTFVRVPAAIRYECQNRDTSETDNKETRRPELESFGRLIRSSDLRCDYLPALLGLALLVLAPPGAVEAGDGACGLAGAAPVVVPGLLLGVTSRTPAGGAGGDVDALV